MSHTKQSTDRVRIRTMIFAFTGAAIFPTFFGLAMMRLIADGLMASLLAGIFFVILFPLVYSLAFGTSGQNR